MALEFSEDDLAQIEELTLSDRPKPEKKAKKNRLRPFTRFFLAFSAVLAAVVAILAVTIVAGVSRVRGLLGEDVFNQLSRGDQIESTGILDASSFQWIVELRWLIVNGPMLAAAISISAALVIVVLGLIDFRIGKRADV